MNDDEFEGRLDDLLATLDEASALLAKHGARRWAAWLSEDRERIANHDRYGVEHLLMAFGGMGSLNDVVFHPMNGNASGEDMDGWDNAELDALRSKLFTDATALRRELNRPELPFGAPTSACEMLSRCRILALAASAAR